MPKTAVLIPAAGRGRRVGGDANKLLLPLDAQPVILHTVRRLHDHPLIHSVHVITAARDRAEFDRVFRERERWPKLAAWIDGGDERQDSVRNGILALEADPPDWVIVHDGARPCLSVRLLERVLVALRQHGAAAPALPIPDTVRRIAAGASEVLPREQLYRVQTPQGFHWNVLSAAHRHAAEHGLRGTDDAQLVEATGLSLAWVEGERRNLKLTAGPDFQLGAWILAHPEWGG
jgi:2-C-methyl-D-erythritol 4-phosphate cytidylyltransferase